MLVVACDSEATTAFKNLDYAADIFQKLADYLINQLYAAQKLTEYVVSTVDSRIKIERMLKLIFRKDI